MSQTQLKIRQALEARLNSFATANSLTVVWENTALSPEGTYLKAIVFRSPTQDPSLGVIHRRYKGLFRIQVWHASLGKGTAQAEALAESIVEYFPRALQIPKDDIIVHIEKTPTQSSPSIETDWVVVTIEAPYRCDTFN